MKHVLVGHPNTFEVDSLDESQDARQTFEIHCTCTDSTVRTLEPYFASVFQPQQPLQSERTRQKPEC